MPPAPSNTAQIVKVLRAYFDVAFYTQRYDDIRPDRVDPLEHYVVFGWKEGRDPCAWFSTRRYLSFHADVAASKVNPFLHYVLVGKQEGRRICPADFAGSVDLLVDKSASFVRDETLRDLIKFPPRPLKPPRRVVAPDRLSLHWLVPDFGAGSGGHMTIFRLIRWLELAGHRSTVWLTHLDQHRQAASAYDDILRHFQTIRARVELADHGFIKASGDAVIATGWQTVARAAHATGFRCRFYLVQDYEPAFHPVGSHGLSASWTYQQDFSCICASPWLAKLLRTNYKRWTRHFWLGYDKDVYYPRAKSRRGGSRGTHRPRIVVYARVGTARRAVELALLTLEHLAAQGVDFHVDLFGEELMHAKAPFPATCHGVLGPAQLATLYREADLGICFSATNYSLVPQEMIACGLPVLELDGESTRATFPPGVVTLAPPHPRAMAAEIAALLKDRERRVRQARAALRWVAQFDWETSAKAVERAFLERLAPAARLKPRSHKRSQPAAKASVCIPTHNGGRLLREVVKRVRAQRAPWPFEVIIVDSSSTDGSVEGLASEIGPKLRIETIASEEFQHGRTRNFCATLARGEFIAFLTQDALPTDEFWLYNMVIAVEHFPKAAGAFGRHLPWPDADPFTTRGIAEHFENLARYPLALSRETDRARWDAGDAAWRQLLHYYSDNNSCMRKSVWADHPYAEADYGEDQLWADRIIQAGYEKLYVPSAIVYHSHHYTVEQTAERAETEAYFFATEFGYRLYDYDRSFNEQLAQIDAADRRWAMANDVPELALARRLLENRAELYGRARGVQRAAARLMQSSAADVRPNASRGTPRRAPPRRGPMPKTRSEFAM